MYDQVYLKTIDPDLINKLSQRKDLIKVRTEYSRDTFILSKYDIKLTFWKVSNKVTDEVYGYNQIKISFNPHKIFNNNLHNGNDFNANDAIKTIQKVYDYLEFEKYEYIDLIATFVEVGVNIIFEDAVNEIINNAHSFKGIPFIQDRWKTNLIAGTPFKKQIHLYNKSLQLKNRGHDLNSINISNDVLRNEIRLYKYELKKLGINNANDLINPKTFERIADLLINDLEYLLIIESNPNKGKYNNKEYKYLKERADVKYWEKLQKLSRKDKKDKNKFNLERKKYNSISQTKKWFNTIIINKILEMKNCDFFSKENEKHKHHSTPGKQKDLEILKNSENVKFSPRAHVKVEKVTNKENKCCKVTGIDISKQKNRNSKFVSETTLYEIKNNDPNLYDRLRNKYLNRDKWNHSKELYYLAHNIRNKYHNPLVRVPKVGLNQITLF